MEISPAAGGLTTCTAQDTGLRAPAIQVSNREETYQTARRELTLFHDLNLEVKAGEMVAIVGQWDGWNIAAHAGFHTPRFIRTVRSDPQRKSCEREGAGLWRLALSVRLFSAQPMTYETLWRGWEAPRD